MNRRRLVIGTAITLGLAGAALMGDAAWIQVKAAVAQVLLDRAFVETVASGGAPVKPWGWADTWPVARIRVPRLAASAIALEGSSGQALAFGPGHVEATPVAGEPGTAVYAAHRDTHGATPAKEKVVLTGADGSAFDPAAEEVRLVALAEQRWNQIEAVEEQSQLGDWVNIPPGLERGFCLEQGCSCSH